MRELLPLLPHPSHYLGIEEGAIHKDKARVRLHMALAFPDTYEVGMSYLGQKILYALCNAPDDWWAERVFAPTREAGAVLRAHNAPLCTLESDTPLAQLHLLGFSVTHELCYTNILYMLDLAGIPLRAAARGDDLARYPLVVVGGGATLSAEPLAPFVDVMILGEGEDSMRELCAALLEARQGGMSRAAFLEGIRHIPGVYVPSLYTFAGPGLPPTPRLPGMAPARRIVPHLDDAAYPVAQVVPIGAVHNRLSLEIARGCTRGCRFCHAGMVYRPARERSFPRLERLLDDCLRETGFDEVSYLSLSTGDFSALKTFFTATVDRCAAEQIAVSLPSLRVGSIDDSIMERMAGIRRTGATLAPEAGSQRLRDVINKGVTEEGLILHVQKLMEHGWQQVKLYFMIGLPTETDADLDAIAELCRKVRDAGGRGVPRLQVTAAISPFVPKPFTPFQWEAQAGLAELCRRIDHVRERFKGLKGCKLRWHEPRMSHLEGILSRADRRMADVVEHAYRKGGIFASWVDGFDLAPWEEALAACGLEAAACIGARAVDAPLPWDHLEAGISREFLLRERERALQGRTSGDCRYETCRQCGACDTKAGPSRLPHVPAGATIGNVLNFPQRDQTAHSPRRDAEGRLLLPQRAGGRAAPPQIAPELVRKAVEYRVWHSRVGGAAFLSQLELQAILERSLRRAGLPMAFSQGFHPLPLLSFGRALPVGVESLAEWFAVTLRQPLGANAVRERLAPHLPRGMGILCVNAVPTGGRTAQAIAERFTLRHTGTQAEQGAFLAAWRDFAARESLIWTRDTKKGPRTYDLRALAPNVRVEDDGLVTLAMDWEAGYLSPLALALAVSGQDALPRLRLTKVAQVFADGTVLPPANLQSATPLAWRMSE